MSLEQFKDLTNAELKEECSDLGIKVFAKNPGKPNKTEYLEAINKHLNYDSAEEVVEEVVAPVAKRQSATKLARLDMFRKDRVIIHDVQESQSKDKDELLSVSWGNRLLGGQTDMVALNGLPQYVRVGALKNMKEATTIIHESKPNGGVKSTRVPRFVITKVAGLTEAELEELSNQQKMRNSKHA